MGRFILNRDGNVRRFDGSNVPARSVPSSTGRAVLNCSTSSAPIGLLIAAALLGAGCQSGRPIASHRLIEHQAVIDFSGLKAAEAQNQLECTGAVPKTWERVGPIANALYSHTQWRSPSEHTAVGAAYIHLPLPLSADLMLYLAKLEYTKRANDGRIASRWTDALGREWFEAENDKYHVQGYALAQGFEGWFVYFGYKVTEPPDMSEISLAARSADSFVPMPKGSAGATLQAGPSSSPAAASSQPSTQPAREGLFGLFHHANPLQVERP